MEMNIGWFSWFLSVLVLILLFLTGYIMQNSVRLFVTGERAQGIVVGLVSLSRTTSEDGKEQSLTPLVEFVTSNGEHIKVSGRSYYLKPSSRIGDVINVAYNLSNPKDAQLLLLEQFPIGAAGLILGFAVFIILIWMGGILTSDDPKMDDPFHLLPKLIAHFHLNPVRFPMIILLSIAIPACVLGTYVTSQRGIDMHENGIKTIGYVTGTERVYSKRNDGTMGSGVFPMITFKDRDGKSYTIPGSTTTTLSRLKTGDVVEVIYLANNPNKGVVNTWSEFWIPPMFFGFVMVALLFLLFYLLSGHKSSVTATGDPEIYKELKLSGVLAIATVIKANPKTRHLRYRIEKDTRRATTKLADFVSLERGFSFWLPPRIGAEIKKGDQFRAYLDSLKPFKKFYIDFSERLGYDQNVKSNAEEVIEEQEAERVIVGKLINLLTTSSPYLSPENVNDIKTLIKEDNLSLAFEKLVTLIMNLTRPLPTPLLKVDWDDILQLGIKLELDELVVDDFTFWEKFQAFKTGLN